MADAPPPSYEEATSGQQPDERGKIFILTRGDVRAQPPEIQPQPTGFAAAPQAWSPPLPQTRLNRRPTLTPQRIKRLKMVGVTLGICCLLALVCYYIATAFSSISWETYYSSH